TRGGAVAGTRVRLRFHVSGLALGVHASAPALTHRWPLLTRGRRLPAAGTSVEVVTNVGSLSIRPRDHCCCYAANERRPHQYPLRSHSSTPLLLPWFRCWWQVNHPLQFKTLPKVRTGNRRGSEQGTRLIITDQKCECD